MLGTPLINRISTWADRSWWRVNRLWRANSIPAAQGSLLRLLEYAHQPSSTSPQPFLLGEIVELYSQEETGVHGRRVHLLSKRLKSGLSLPDALEQTPDVLSDDTMLAIRLASQSGTLPQTLQHLRQQATRRLTCQRDAANTPSWRHFFVLLLILIGLGTFICALIAPNFLKIYSEFGMEPPRVFLSLSHTWPHNLIMFLPVGLLSAILMWGLSSRFGLARWFRRRLGSFFSERLRRLRSAQVLELLGCSMQAGRPADGALATLARYHFDPMLRHRLLVARNEIELREGLPRSLRSAGLITRDQENSLKLLDSSVQQGWLLQQLAERIPGDVQRRDRLLCVAAQVLVTCLFGLVVLWFCIAMFSVLNGLVHSLA
ncbi:MAG: type II secretion system F family protein [Pirellulaceae bacterium]|nr:type II secretion system F family protein [Pirellulaceae bacterium]